MGLTDRGYSNGVSEVAVNGGLSWAACLMYRGNHGVREEGDPCNAKQVILNASPNIPKLSWL